MQRNYQWFSGVLMCVCLRGWLCVCVCVCVCVYMCVWWSIVFFY